MNNLTVIGGEKNPPTLGSALAKMLKAETDEERKQAAEDMVTAQERIAKEAAPRGIKVTFGVKTQDKHE